MVDPKYEIYILIIEKYTSKFQVSGIKDFFKLCLVKLEIFLEQIDFLEMKMINLGVNGNKTEVHHVVMVVVQHIYGFANKIFYNCTEKIVKFLKI